MSDRLTPLNRVSRITPQAQKLGVLGPSQVQ